MPVYGKDWQVRYCPVQPQQITAAMSLYSDHLFDQARVDGALASLATLLPDHTGESNSLKMIALDSLCGIRHAAIDAYVDRVKGLTEWPSDSREAVERLTGGYMYGGNELDWRLASSFVHWFVDGGMPIYDRWTKRGLGLHYELMWRMGSVYRDFSLHLILLRDQSGLSCSIREFCQYLRLTGMHDLWLKRRSKRSLGFGGEVRQLFESAAPEVQKHLMQLRPQP